MVMTIVTLGEELVFTHAYKYLDLCYIHIQYCLYLVTHALGPYVGGLRLRSNYVTRKFSHFKIISNM